jgi:hypothetical protein
MEEVRTAAGAGTGTQKNGFWTPGTEDKAIDTMRALHPKLKKLSTIQKRIEGSADANGLRTWMTIDFWKKEIDLTLIEGIYGGKLKRAQAIERIRAVWPELDAEALSRRMEQLASASQPEWFRKSFWNSLDPILLAGMKLGRIAERQAIDKVIRMHQELRIERVWARIRDLRRRNQKAKGPRTGRFPWTEEQEQRLVVLCGEVGLREAVSLLKRETGWPRDAILRKAHKLGIQKKEYQRKQEWSEVERTFLLAAVRHVPVKRIARQLERPEKAVRVRIWREGLPGGWEEGYSRRELCRNFRISSTTLRRWIRTGLLKDGADGRIPERSVRTFLRHHRELVDWGRLDTEDRQWALELCAKDEEDEVGGPMEEHSGDDLKPSTSKQIAATGQTLEAQEVDPASSGHIEASSR